VVIAAVTLTVFIRALSADFVAWDDDQFIYENPSLGGFTLENLRKILTNATVSSTWYTPLTGLRWCMTYQFCQLNPLGYHLGNLLLHTADAVLVFFVLRKLLILGLSGPGRAEPWRITGCASLGALLWSLHPMRVEVACWAANAYCQAMLFLFISLLCYLGAHEAKTTGRRRWLLAISWLSYAASLLSQPLGIGFLGVLFVLDVYLLGRLGGDRGWWKSATKDARRALLEKLPFVGVATAIVLINTIVHVRSPIGAHRLVSLAEFGLLDRLMQAMYVWAYYIWRPWYPFNLSPVYTTLVSFEPFSWKFIVSAIAIVGGTTVLIVLRRRWPLGLALGICHLTMLVGVLGLTDHPHYASDRYSILVAMNWSILLAAWLARPETKSLARRITVVVSIIVIGALGFLSVRQARIWDNSVTLFEHMIRDLGDDPHRDSIHYRLGVFLSRQGQNDKAIEHFKEAIRINPTFTEGSLHLAALLSRQNQYGQAIDYLNQARMVSPDRPDIYSRLGKLYLLHGETQSAAFSWRKALELKPDSVSVLNNLAYLLATCNQPQIRNPQEAIHLAQRACELTREQEPVPLHTLAAAYASARRFSDAVAAADKALRLAQELGQKELADGIRYHVELYKARLLDRGESVNQNSSNP